MRGFGKTSKNGKRASPDSCFRRSFVYLGNFTNQTVFLFVQIVGSKYARRDGTRTRSELLESAYEFEIFLQEDFACDLECFSVCTTCTIRPLFSVAILQTHQ
jgi:hypothetical protein